MSVASTTDAFTNKQPTNARTHGRHEGSGHLVHGHARRMSAVHNIHLSIPTHSPLLTLTDNNKKHVTRESGPRHGQ